MRLFEAEVRADSMTAWAAGPNWITQASNFSFFSRSEASPLSETLSMPNCRKHSERVFLPGSFMSTRATRAEAFLVLRVGRTPVPRDLSITGNDCPEIYSVTLHRQWQRRRRPIPEY